MPKELKEIQIIKYKQGTHPHYNGEVIYSCITDSKDGKKLKAVERLADIIKANDPDYFYYTRGDAFQLLKMKKDAAFNDPGKIVYSKTIKDNKDFHLKAHKRLAKFLTERDKEYIYFAQNPLKENGKNVYIITTRATKMFDEKDKLKIWKRKIAAQKGAITRNINKAKKIREKFKDSLFADNYKNDKRFKSLVKNLYKQKARVQKLLRSDYRELSTISGGYNLKSVFKIEGAVGSMSRFCVMK